MAPTRIILQFIGLAVLLATPAVAIKCYNCESTTDPECSVITKDTKLQAKDCTTAMAAVESANWIRALIRITFFTDKEQPSTNNMVCQTIVGKRGNNVTTIRTCQFDSADTDQCDVAKQQLREKSFPDSSIETCIVCKTDLCNGAHSYFAPALRMVALVSLVVVLGNLYPSA